MAGVVFWEVQMKLARINFHQEMMDSWLPLKETGVCQGEEQSEFALVSLQNNDKTARV